LAKLLPILHHENTHLTNLGNFNNFLMEQCAFKNVNYV